MTNSINESRDLSGKANLSGGNAFTGNQIINGAININTTTGVLIVPRMTSIERNALPGVNNGSIIFNTSTQVFNIYQGGQWNSFVLAQQSQTIEGNKTFTGEVSSFTGKLGSSAEGIDGYSIIIGQSGSDNRISIGQEQGQWHTYIQGIRKVGNNPSTNSSLHIQRYGGSTFFSGNVSPRLDNTNSVGVSSTKWASIWSANGTIQTSDERQKTEITESSLGLEFIEKLKPVSYKWKVGGNEVEYGEIEVEKEVQETFEEIQKIETIEKINGKFVKVIKEEKIQIPVYDEVDLYNEAGEIIGKHQIPKMIKKIVTEKKEIVTPKLGKRNHFGLLAQEVEEALNGVDFGGLVIDENGQYALRYDQFISPLIKAVKELSERVKILENNQ